MLYLTTRNKNEACTAHWTLHQDMASDGGAYIPMKLPCFSQQELLSLRENTFGQNVANILNAFFPAKLTGWEVEVLIGRTPVRLEQMNHRLLVAEVWHNLEKCFSYQISSLYARLAGTPEGAPTDWVKIAVRIAVLFGIYGLHLQAEAENSLSPLDIAVAAADFSAPMAAWYAREMGLPIGMIICGCEDNSAAWELLHNGTVTGVDSRLTAGTERLIQGALGFDEATRFADCCKKRSTYTLAEGAADILGGGMFAAVIGPKRIPSVMNSVYRTSRYILDPEAAAALGGLHDYRASRGESRLTLLLSEDSPLNAADAVSSATGLPVNALMDYVKLP